MFIDFFYREGVGGGGRERHTQTDRYLCERETLISCLLYAPQPGIEPTIYVCALTGDHTHNLLVHGTMLQPTEPPGQDYVSTFLLNNFYWFFKLACERLKLKNQTNDWSFTTESLGGTLRDWT